VALTGAQASEAALRANAPGKEILHLATHGFFLSEGCSVPGTANARGIGGLSTSAGAPPGSLDDPLLRSGLVLAGANQRQDAAFEGDDGILTAAEAAMLDLSGVRLAVLSACETGRGDIAASEGILGLRRAFQVAGVRTLLTSLWAVDDAAARAWMEEFYTALLQSEFDPAAAVREASLRRLQARRQEGMDPHPFFWAGFVSAGH
jgi:CHAT domain-containing protein